MKTKNRLIEGSDSPSFHASSENDIGTAKAKAPIDIWLISSRLKLKLIKKPHSDKPANTTWFFPFAFAM